MCSRRTFLASLPILWGAANSALAESLARTRIRMASSGNYRPFTFKEGTGPMRGIVVDILGLVEPGAGVVFDYSDLPWARAQQMVKAGQIDAVCTIATAERRGYIDFAPTPLFAEPTVLVYREGNDRAGAAETPADLHDLTIVEPLGTGWVKETLKGQRIEWESDVDHLLDMIAAGRIDASLLGQWSVAVRFAETGRRGNLKTKVFGLAPEDNEIRFGLRKTFPNAAGIVAAVDTALAAVRASGAIDHIVEKYTL